MSTDLHGILVALVTPFTADGKAIDDANLKHQVERMVADAAAHETDDKKRREILYDIQRYASQQVYYGFGPSVSAVGAWMPYVKNFGPNIGHDYGEVHQAIIQHRPGRV